MKTLYDQCVENKKQELLDEWDEDSNQPHTPQNTSYGSNKKVHWTCNKGHHWDARVSGRTVNKRGCPYCSNTRVLTGYNDLATVFP